MLTNFKLFEDNFFDSYKDFVDGKPIENPFEYAMNCSDEDLDKVADYLLELYSKIPESYYKNFKIDISNFYHQNKQLSFTTVEVLNKITKLLATKRSKFVTNLAILTCFDYSFLEYIIGENPNFKANAERFKKSNDEVDSVYYSNITKFKRTLLRSLENLDSNRDVESFLYRSADMAVACGLEPDCIPNQSIISRYFQLGSISTLLTKVMILLKTTPLWLMTLMLILLSLVGIWRKNQILILLSTKMVFLTANIVSNHLNLMEET
nr:hypothetical protein [Petroclostridium xylanilyticum]